MSKYEEKSEGIPLVVEIFLALRLKRLKQVYHLLRARPSRTSCRAGAAPPSSLKNKSRDGVEFTGEGNQPLLLLKSLG